MKHIGWCLDRIQILMADIPVNISSDEDAKKAGRVLDEVQEYAQTLGQLIKNPKFKKYLQQLEKSSIDGVKLEANDIEALLNDLEHMLQLLDLYLAELRQLLSHKSYQWHYKLKQIIYSSVDMFNKNKRKLGKEYTIIENYKDLLRRYLNRFKFKAYELTHAIDLKFGGERGELRKEFQATLYNIEELKQLVKSEKHLEEFLKL